MECAYNEIIERLNRINGNLDFANYKIIQLELNSISRNELFSLPVDNDTFLLFSYNFLKNVKYINLGDYVQTFATKQAIDKVFLDKNFVYHDRDHLQNFVPRNKNNKSCISIMQGYFPPDLGCIPNKYISPVFIGFHLGGVFGITGEDRWIIDYFKKLSQAEEKWKDLYIKYPDYFSDKQIGCRDKSTKKFFEMLGVDAYFSRCLSLTFSKRIKTEQQTKVFISCRKQIENYLPDSIKESAIIFSPELDPEPYSYKSVITHQGNQRIFELAKQQLENIKNNAKLVVTDRIHLAAPSIAMGIPTVLIKLSDEDIRYDIFDGILKIYSIDELKKGVVDFNPQCPEFEDLKDLMLQNLKLSVESLYSEVDKFHLGQIREKIENYCILDI